MAVTFSLGGLTAESFDGERAAFSAEMRRLVAYAELAEAGGLDGVFVSEHHGVAEGHLAAPFVALGAVAQATERVRIGTNIALAPLYQPVRLAEDVAAVDLLSEGRMVLGIGLGYRASEFAAMGVVRSQRARLLEAAVATIRAAWSGQPIAESAEGPVTVWPPPHQDPGPPVWIGAFAEPGVRRARRIGDGYIAPTVSVRAVEKRLGWLGEEGPLEGFDVALSLNGFVGAGDAWATVSAPLLFIERRYKAWMAEADDLSGAAEMRRRHEAMERPPHLIVGDPDQCIAQLLPWTRILATLPGGARGHLQIRLTYPGISAHHAHESVRLFAAEVVPALRATAASVG
jgi:alkanesulfonate monooxygenase SsuD/methylene tetrahydromethanopterin reductase-like flavin-dependent oxidoreductase (luciferase family)